MKKLRIVLIILSVILLAGVYVCMNPIKVKHPKDRNDELRYDVKGIYNDNALAFLSNLTKKPHPTSDNEEEFMFIKNYLDEIGADYTVYEETLTFEKYKDFVIKNINNDYMKPKVLKEAGIKEEDLKGMGYDSYAEYLWDIAMKYSAEEETLEDWIRNNYERDGYLENVVFKNILVELGIHSDDKENVLFSVHYDSGLTLDEDEKAESYGAGDNGMAVAAMLENIRVHKDDDFKNNVYVLIDEGEEDGLYGAMLFMTSNVLDNIKLVINMDSASNKGHLAMYRVTGNKKVLFDKYQTAIGSNYSFSFWKELNSVLSLGFGSDYDVYSNYGDAIDLALFAKHTEYHTKDDNYENISVDSLNENVATIDKLMVYFGNDLDSYSSKEEAIAIPILFTSVVLSKKVYLIAAGVCLLIAIPLFIFNIFKKRYGIKEILLYVGLIALTVLCYLNMKELMFISILPMLCISLKFSLKLDVKTCVNVILYFLDLILVGEVIATLISIIYEPYVFASLILLVIPLIILLNIKTEYIKL